MRKIKKEKKDTSPLRGEVASLLRREDESFFGEEKIKKDIPALRGKITKSPKRKEAKKMKSPIQRYWENKDLPLHERIQKEHQYMREQML